MPVSERDRARLDVLIAIVKPANSLASRLEKLTDEQRDCHAQWSARCDRFFAQHPEGKAYELSLDGYGPRVRDDIHVALWGQTPQILIADSDDKAAEKYREYAR